MGHPVACQNLRHRQWRASVKGNGRPDCERFRHAHAKRWLPDSNVHAALYASICVYARAWKACEMKYGERSWRARALVRHCHLWKRVCACACTFQQRKTRDDNVLGRGLMKKRENELSCAISNNDRPTLSSRPVCGHGTCCRQRVITRDPFEVDNCRSRTSSAGQVSFSPSCVVSA